MEKNKPSRTIQKLEAGIPAKLAAIGDSLTYGWMTEKGYLDFLHEMLVAAYPEARVSISNRGIPGDTAASGLYRLQSDVIAHHPDCVLIQFALNDAFSGYSQEEFGQNIHMMIRRISEETEAEIVLVTSVWIPSPAENRRALQYYARLESAARDHKLALAEVHTVWKERIESGLDVRQLVQYDGVHPTVLGYKLMAEAVAEVFKK